MTILDEIIEHKKIEIEKCKGKVPVSKLENGSCLNARHCP